MWRINKIRVSASYSFVSPSPCLLGCMLLLLPSVLGWRKWRSVCTRNICLLAITVFKKYLFIVNLISFKGEICTSIYLHRSWWVQFVDRCLMIEL